MSKWRILGFVGLLGCSGGDTDPGDTDGEPIVDTDLVCLARPQAEWQVLEEDMTDPSGGCTSVLAGPRRDHPRVRRACGGLIIEA